MIEITVRMVFDTENPREAYASMRQAIDQELSPPLHLPLMGLPAPWRRIVQNPEGKILAMHNISWNRVTEIIVEHDSKELP